MATFQYQIQRGETPATIAQRHNLTPQELLRANPGGYPFVTGQTIRIPTPARGIGNVDPNNPWNTNPWGQLFKTINQQSRTAVDPFAPIGGDPIKNAINSTLKALGPGLSYSNAFPAAAPARSPVGSVTSPYPVNMPRGEQRNFSSQAIGAPGQSTNADYRGGLDINSMVNGGFAPDTVNPYVASYINQKAVEQGKPPIYFADGTINPDALAGAKGSSTPSQTQGNVVKQGDQAWQSASGWKGYNNKHGFSVVRRPNGSLVLNKQQRLARYRHNNAGAQPRAGIGLVSFHVGSG